MTAQVAVMNKEAVALASDSAFTMTGEGEQRKVTSGNKLFALSWHSAVAIMVHGEAHFVGLPWETIIKVYRAKVGKQRFDTLQAHADHFIRFLDRRNPLFPASQQKQVVYSLVNSYFYSIREHIEEKVQSAIGEKSKTSSKGSKGQGITYAEVRDIVSHVINEQHDIWRKRETLPSLPKNHGKNVLAKYSQTIAEAIETVFEKLPLTKTSSKRLETITAALFSKDLFLSGTSGIVIAGFGEKDAFPSLVFHKLELFVNNRLKYKKHFSKAIDFETHARIIPFAQKQMVITFMEGITPDLHDKMTEFLSEIFEEYPEVIIEGIQKLDDKEKQRLVRTLKKKSKEIFQKYQRAVRDYREEHCVDPITSVVTMLPKDQLASMAESLVSLTSFKLRVTMETETVREPIDVAVISKGDGFVWIKRKHYFKPELNPQFFAKYNRR